MTIALMTDIHANREAFEACLAHASEHQAEHFVFLGDFVGYGADPEWVLDTLMEHVARGDYEMVGTFNGNPLAVAACRAMLTEVATPEAYRRIDALRHRAVSGIEREIARTGLQAHVVAVVATRHKNRDPNRRDARRVIRCDT